MWLHWVLVAVVIVSNLWVIEIGHLWGVEDRSEYSNTAGHTSQHLQALSRRASKKRQADVKSLMWPHIDLPPILTLRALPILKHVNQPRYDYCTVSREFKAVTDRRVCKVNIAQTSCPKTRRNSRSCRQLQRLVFCTKYTCPR